VRKGFAPSGYEPERLGLAGDREQASHLGAGGEPEGPHDILTAEERRSRRGGLLGLSSRHHGPEQGATGPDP
jgi:hypothetical protein